MEEKDLINFLEQIDVPEVNNPVHQSSLRSLLLQKHKEQQKAKESFSVFEFINNSLYMKRLSFVSALVLLAVLGFVAYRIQFQKPGAVPQVSQKPVENKNEPIQKQNPLLAQLDNKPLPAGGSAGRGDEGGIRSPDGKRIILIQTSEGEGAEGQVVYYITIDGKDGRSFNFIGEAVFSPDSKQYAYAAGNVSKQFIILNGRELKIYDYVNTPAFSPNSSRFVYIASIGQQPNGKQFVVIDGVEGKQYQKVELAFSDYGRGFSLNSKHLVYSASENNQWFVVIDGKEGNKYDSVSEVTISVDGKKVTYKAQIGSSAETITENLD